MNKLFYFLTVGVLFLSACVGTDELDDPDGRNTTEVTDKTETRAGVFSGSGSYVVEGNASLFYDEKEDLILEFSQDFAVSSFGAAIYVYMSNISTGIAGGIEIQQLTKEGAQSFNLTTVDPTLTIKSYNYIIIHCKPFNIPFGQSSKLE